MFPKVFTTVELGYIKSDVCFFLSGHNKIWVSNNEKIRVSFTIIDLQSHHQLLFKERVASKRHHHEWPQTKDDFDQYDFVPMGKPQQVGLHCCNLTKHKYFVTVPKYNFHTSVLYFPINITDNFYFYSTTISRAILLTRYIKVKSEEI